MAALLFLLSRAQLLAQSPIRQAEASAAISSSADFPKEPSRQAASRLSAEILFMFIIMMVGMNKI